MSSMLDSDESIAFDVSMSEVDAAHGSNSRIVHAEEVASILYTCDVSVVNAIAEHDMLILLVRRLHILVLD